MELCFFKDEEFDKTFLNMLYKVVAVSSFLQLLKREIFLKSSKFPFRFEFFQFQLKLQVIEKSYLRCYLVPLKLNLISKRGQN